jgi:hypothetical protein
MSFEAQKQIDKAHYACGGYGFEGRFVSYYHQLREVLSRNPQSVLEVGVGDRVFGNFIKDNTSVSYTSVDIAEDLHPDKVGSITSIPMGDKSVDIACAFEVLEHIPFEEFDQAVGELVRVARRYVVISVPHFGPMLSFSLKIPFLPRVRFAFKVPYPKAHVFNGQHYWEVGKQGYPVSLIRQKLCQHGQIIADYVPFNSDYHHFFVVHIG